MLLLLLMGFIGGWIFSPWLFALSALATVGLLVMAGIYLFGVASGRIGFFGKRGWL